MTSATHDPRLQRLLDALPAFIARSYAWLVQPGHDIPPVHRATLAALGKVQRWWDRRRARR